MYLHSLGGKIIGWDNSLMYNAQGGTIDLFMPVRNNHNDFNNLHLGYSLETKNTA